jgi:hypothetical protein
MTPLGRLAASHDRRPNHVASQLLNVTRALEITNDFELAWESLCADLDRDRTHRMLSRFVRQSHLVLQARHPIGHIRPLT